jgi:hypothetical protein
MPLTVLLGMAPAGMDATGESDMILYFNKVDAYRRDALEAPLSRLVGLVAQTLGIGGEWSLVWPELARPKPLDVATADNMRVTSLCQLIQNNVVLPEEAALSLGRVAPALGVSLDPEPREEALEEALKQLAEGGAEPVAPVGEDPETGPDEPSVQPPPERKSERKTPAKAAKRQT